MLLALKIPEWHPLVLRSKELKNGCGHHRWVLWAGQVNEHDLEADDTSVGWRRRSLRSSGTKSPQRGSLRERGQKHREKAMRGSERGDRNQKWPRAAPVAETPHGAWLPWYGRPQRRCCRLKDFKSRALLSWKRHPALWCPLAKHLSQTSS